MNSATRGYCNDLRTAAWLVALCACWSLTACNSPTNGSGAGPAKPSGHASAAPAVSYSAPSTSADAQQSRELEERISALIRTINDNHDELHAEMTPSVWHLIDIGRPALPPLVELL